MSGTTTNPNLLPITLAPTTTPPTTAGTTTPPTTAGTTTPPTTAGTTTPPTTAGTTTPPTTAGTTTPPTTAGTTTPPTTAGTTTPPTTAGTTTPPTTAGTTTPPTTAGTTTPPTTAGTTTPPTTAGTTTPPTTAGTTTPPTTTSSITPPTSLPPPQIVTITVPTGVPTIVVVNPSQNTSNVVQQVQNVQTVLVDISQTLPNNTPPTVVGTSTTPPAPLSTTDNFQVVDGTANQAFHTPGTDFTGGVSGITHQYVNINPDNLNVTAITPNAFIQTGDGNDTLSAFSGRDVLDAGRGSNVMIGGVGADTFVASAGVASAGSGQTSSVVDLIQNFHAGDDAVIHGLNVNDFSLNFSDSTGAFGPELLLTATPNSGQGPSATVALAGFSTGDVANGRLSTSFSTDPQTGQPFMLIHANS